jgi:hypothetical protein
VARLHPSSSSSLVAAFFLTTGVVAGHLLQVVVLPGNRSPLTGSAHVPHIGVERVRGAGVGAAEGGV